MTTDKGDYLYLTERCGAASKLSALNERLVEQIGLGAGVMDRYCDPVRALAAL